MLEEEVRADPGFAERYELFERLGSGNMGSVWRGQQRALARPVAIKFMSRELVNEPAYRERFAAEARLVAGLIHSNVTAVFDFGIAAGVPYLVTELVTGDPLDRVLARPGALSASDMIDVAEQVLSALTAIHEMGILHRDLKPSNIMVSAARPPRTKLLDFGIAKKLGEERGITQVGMVMGSPAYMSPEQAAGQKLSPASDLYALTIVLHEMVFGYVPYVAEQAVDMLRLRLERDAVIPPDLLPGVANLLRRGLSREPADRLRDAPAYRAAFEQAAREVRTANSFYPPGKTLIGRFVAAPPKSGMTVAGTTVAGTAVQPAATASAPARQVPGPITPGALPGAARQPQVAVAILLLLLALAVAARAHQHAGGPEPAPVVASAGPPPAPIDGVPSGAPDVAPAAAPVESAAPEPPASASPSPSSSAKPRSSHAKPQQKAPFYQRLPGFIRQLRNR